MSAIFEETEQFHNDVDVLVKIRQPAFAQAIFDNFVGSNIQTIGVSLEDDCIAIFTYRQKLIRNDYINFDASYSFENNINEKLDITQHGNAGIAAFLEEGIELSVVDNLHNELNECIETLAILFDLKDNENVLMITSDDFWLVNRTTNEQV